jgi:hypothetical protein
MAEWDITIERLEQILSLMVKYGVEDIDICNTKIHRSSMLGVESYPMRGGLPLTTGQTFADHQRDLEDTKCSCGHLGIEHNQTGCLIGCELEKCNRALPPKE